ncbi:DsbC family protein [Candidatus Dactylopiibacterium carminicum]|nr:DsbC family protein [Candidatus Dactylopiibacterium carminicum]
MKTILSRAMLVATLATVSVGVRAGEAEVRTSLGGILGEQTTISSLSRTNHGGMWEAVLSNGDIVYVDDKGDFLLTGNLFDLKNKRNVTAEREAELNRVNIAELSLKQAFKLVRGNGKRTLITFEDPNCGYCKKLAQDLRSLKDATVYVFLIPILSPDSADKARNIWCAKDRAATWDAWMLEGKVPAKAECSTPIASNTELARKYRISGTPTMFLADGSRLGGYLPLADLDRMINEAEVRAKGVAKK